MIVGYDGLGNRFSNRVGIKSGGRVGADGSCVDGGERVRRIGV